MHSMEAGAMPPTALPQGALPSMHSMAAGAMPPTALPQGARTVGEARLRITQDAFKDVHAALHLGPGQQGAVADTCIGFGV